MQTDTKLLYVAVVYSIGCCRIVGPLRSALWIPLPAFRRRPQVLTAWSSDLKGYGYLWYLGSVQRRSNMIKQAHLWKVFGKFEKSEAFDSARSLTLDSVPEAFCQRDTMRRRPAPQTELTRRFRIQWSQDTSYTSYTRLQKWKHEPQNSVDILYLLWQNVTYMTLPLVANDLRKVVLEMSQSH